MLRRYREKKYYCGDYLEVAIYPVYTHPKKRGKRSNEGCRGRCLHRPFGLRTHVKVGEQLLAEYSYTNDGNNYLNSLDYGNGDSVEYNYDSEGRVISQTYEDGDTVTYRYNNDGNLAKVADSAIGRMYQYTYDLTDRLTKYEESGTSHSFFMTYEYDANNRLVSGAENTNGYGRSVFYTYDGDNRLASYQKGWMKQNYTYDAFGRNSKKVLKDQKDGSTLLTTNYTFRTVNGNATGQVSQVSLDSQGYDVTYSYTYDNNGNILSVSDGTYTTTYQYDEANQLIRENNQKEGYTYTWVYGESGNIENRREYDYTTAEIVISENPGTLYNYHYTNTAWKDQLTAINDRTFTYDAIGNVLTDGNWGYTWEHGRQLATMFDGATTWTNTYNADGLRTKRTDGTNTYQYYYCDGDLVSMSYNGSNMYFSYTPDGVPYIIVYQKTSYMYLTNLQGDVMAIITTAGEVVVEYAYDAWGNVLSVTGSMADTLGQDNPLRYRGYTYDRETQLYYLQSRYYDPELGRFINADGQISAPGSDILGNNMYAYCFNNPVNMQDECGNWPKWLENTVKVVSVVVAVAAVVATVAAVSAFTAGTGSAAAVYGASILLGAALSGINGGIANEAKGNSYTNGYLGGAMGGAIQAASSKNPGGVIVGGGVGVTVGTTVTDLMNNLDPDSTNSTPQDIAMNAFSSGGKALFTSSLTAYIGYASDLAVVNGANGLMPTYTAGFGEGVKSFFGWLDDALVYIWE